MLNVDYSMPISSSLGEESFHRFTDATRRSFVEALTIKTMTRSDTFELLQKVENLAEENEALKAENASLKRRLKK